jgi:hypothetical protein
MSGKVSVAFADVGRGKRSWIAELPAFTEAALERQVRKNGGLASRGIEVQLVSETEGVVLVGGFRVVGRFSIQGAAK